ncbi:MAG: hypothetical protein ABR508_12525, partial [Candidatus Baltobacteraceae bacterium]
IVNGIQESAFSITGLSPTFNATTLQRFSCNFTVSDQFSSIPGESVTVTAFVEPHPAPNSLTSVCAPDSLGHCVASNDTSSLASIICFTQPIDGQASAKVPELLGTASLTVYSLDGSVISFNRQIIDDGTGNCTTSAIWSPMEPSVYFGDPQLP